LRKIKTMQIVCDYCGKLAQFRTSSTFIYKVRDYGPVYFCPCKFAYVGVHKGTNRPLGRLADGVLRKARKEAHKAFDPFWKSEDMRRADAYKWLSEKLGIHRLDCHIGMFDDKMCRRVVRACKRKRKCDG